MSWFSGFKNPFASAPETPRVAAAKEGVKKAQAELEAAENEAANQPPPSTVTPPSGPGMASNVGGRRSKTKRSKKSKSKRSRTGRKSNRL